MSTEDACLCCCEEDANAGVNFGERRPLLNKEPRVYEPPCNKHLVASTISNLFTDYPLIIYKTDLGKCLGLPEKV